MASRRNPGLQRYLLDGERIVVAVHQHWSKVAEPVATVVGGLLLALWLDFVIPPTAGVVATIAWWVWFFLLARLVWQLLEWRHNWLCATDKRLLLTYGLLTRQVAMMPLMKVTDMSYSRSIPGQLLGYGKFVMESAGHEQALREVNWVPNPDHTYRAICAEIFGVDDHDRVLDEADALDGSGLTGAVPYAGWHGDEYAHRSAVQEHQSRAIPLSGTGSGPGPGHRGRADREADTGPLPVDPARDPGDD